MNTCRTGLLLPLLAGCLLALAGCKKFEVPLTTPEPIKIDPIEVEIRIDVFQHGEESEGEAARERAVEDANQRTQNRTGEVQQLKDHRIVGENHRGLLSIRNPPEDAGYAEYARKLVREENADRTVLMRDAARSREEQLHDVQKSWWRDKQRSAIPGEWIGVEAEEEGQFEWVQKKSGQS